MPVRLLPEAKLPSTQPMPKDGGGQRVIVCLRMPGAGIETTLRVERDGDPAMFFLVVDGFGCLVIDKLPSEPPLAVADAARLVPAQQRSHPLLRHREWRGGEVMLMESYRQPAGLDLGHFSIAASRRHRQPFLCLRPDPVELVQMAVRCMDNLPRCVRQ